MKSNPATFLIVNSSESLYIDLNDVPPSNAHELDEAIGRSVGYEYIAVLGL
jgi:hypothetical protein